MLKMNEETLLKLIDLNQIAIQELGSQIGQDLMRIEQRLERVEDFMNQYYKNKVKEIKEDE
jgi:hypothetical protein